MAHVVELAGSVCASDHLEAKGWLQVSDLQQHQGQVLYEEQSIHQRGSVLHDPPVVPLPGLQHPHAVEQPVRRHEQEHQHHQQAAEDKEAGERGARRPEEQRPGGDEQDQELEGQRDVEAFAGRAAGLEGVTPQDLWEDEEGQRCDQGEEAQAASQSRANESLALQRSRLLQLFGDAGQVLVRDAVFWGAGDDRGGLAPVIILSDKEEYIKIHVYLGFIFTVYKTYKIASNAEYKDSSGLI